MTQVDAGRAVITACQSRPAERCASVTFGAGTPGCDSAMLVTVELGEGDLERLRDFANDALRSMNDGDVHRAVFDHKTRRAL